MGVDLLDNFYSNKNIKALKIDVEGYEPEVLKGSEKILNSDELNVIIIELNHYGENFGYSNEYLVEFLRRKGFEPFRYHPFQRKLEKLNSFDEEKFNTIFIKNLTIVKKRIETSQAIKVSGYKI